MSRCGTAGRDHLAELQRGLAEGREGCLGTPRQKGREPLVGNWSGNAAPAAASTYLRMGPCGCYDGDGEPRWEMGGQQWVGWVATRQNVTTWVRNSEPEISIPVGWFCN